MKENFFVKITLSLIFDFFPVLRNRILSLYLEPSSNIKYTNPSSKCGILVDTCETHYNLESFLPGGSMLFQGDDLNPLTDLTQNIISKTTNDEKFEWKKVSGSISGDSFERSYIDTEIGKILRKCSNMIEMGSYVKTSKINDEMSLDEKISVCKRHGECRFNETVNLVTHNWHSATYWSNYGGSHHGALLAHLLDQASSDWSPEKINNTCYSIDLKEVNKLITKYHVYVIDRSLYSCDDKRIFKQLPKMIFPIISPLSNTEKYLGLRTSHDSGYLFKKLSEYTFIYIDMDHPLCQISDSIFQNLVVQKKAETFINFISDVMNIKSNS